ncbi:50S ribosomal protein L13 [Candidatus Woesearchaeota archaeon]|nr:50S ribosomal protein L13 [Candidatus Woesearchaeota archaeon]
MLIDATDLIVGRLGAIVAKKALLGEKIDIVNAENAVISGKKAQVLANYKQRVERKTWSKGPHYKRNPDMLLKRLIRDMLPYKKPRGIAAYKRIMCWEGVPDQFKDQKPESLEEAHASKLPSFDYVSVKQLSRFLGGNVD